MLHNKAEHCGFDRLRSAQPHLKSSAVPFGSDSFNIKVLEMALAHGLIDTSVGAVSTQNLVIMTDIGSFFEYEPLDPSAQQIRLLSIVPKAEGPIQCTLRHFDLNATPTPDYKALSYRWGPPLPVQGIEVNGKLFTVQQNLYDPLHTFRARLFKFSGSG